MFWFSVNLIEEIKTQEKDIQSVEQTERHLRQMIESMEKEIQRKSEEFEDQMTEMIAIRDHFQRQLEVKRQAYQSLNDCDSDLKNELKALQTEVESIEKQIQEIKEKTNQVSIDFCFQIH